MDLSGSAAAIADTAAGVLAVELSRPAGEYVLWLRGEQVREVRWAGNPNKPVLPTAPDSPDVDPVDLLRQ